MERTLAKWEPAASYLVPEGTRQSDPMALVGEWRARYEGTTVTFGAPVDGTMPVFFRTWGCLASWTLRRTATLKDGLVQLNKAVQSYCGEPYDRYFFVKKGETLWLAPAGTLEQGLELVEKAKAGSKESWFEFFSLQKSPPRAGGSGSALAARTLVAR
jgi:hypothetical protein